MKKRILITGAGSGIGHDTALALAERGHEVIATTETEEQVNRLRDEIRDKKVSLEVRKLDITNEQDREQVVGLPLDVLLNNAAVGESGPLAEIPLDRLQRSLEVNVFSTVALTQHVLPEMLAHSSGRLIFVTSIAGRLVIPFLGAYHMSKFALEAAADAFRLELKPFGIDVAIIEPGLIGTGFNERMAATKYEWLKPSSPFARFF